MKIYTKTGDDGTTGLLGGRRTEKDTARIESFGCVDELNCAVGMANCATNDNELSQILVQIQNHLFELGADLATPEDEKASIPRINEHHIRELEDRIDNFWPSLPPMKHFILPGGCELAARLHLARSLCRRAERHAVTLSRSEPIKPDVKTYLNRLSDLLFVLARRANQLANVEDVPWNSGRRADTLG